MNVTHGIGNLALEPQRLLMFAYAPNSLPTTVNPNPAPTDIYESQMLSGTLEWGYLGACRTATVVLVGRPEWIPRSSTSRWVRFRLLSEQGEGVIWAGKLENIRPLNRLGTRWELSFVGLHQRWQNARGTGLPYALPALGARIYGSYGGADLWGNPKGGRREARYGEYWAKFAENEPFLEWGNSADSWMIAGSPGTGVPAYNLDSRAQNLKATAYGLPPAVTGWYGSAGSEWALQTYARADVPLLADFNDVSVPIELGQSEGALNGSLGSFYVNGNGSSSGSSATLTDYTAVAGIAYTFGVPGPDPNGTRMTKVKSAAKTLNLNMSSMTGKVKVQILMSVSNGGGYRRNETFAIDFPGTYAITFQAPEDTIGVGGTVTCEFVIDTYLAGAATASSASVSVTEGSGILTQTVQYGNSFESVTGLNYPYFYPPNYDFDLPRAVLVPPYQVQGIGDGVTRYATSRLSWSAGSGSSPPTMSSAVFAGVRPWG